MIKISLRNNGAIQKLYEQLTIEANLLIRNELSRLKESLVEATPVDTGLAKHSWRLVSAGNGRHIIVNDTPYIKFLNAGSSKQAPAFFVEAIALRYGRPRGVLVSYK